MGCVKTAQETGSFLGRFAEAIELYDEYLASPDLPADRRALAGDILVGLGAAAAVAGLIWLSVEGVRARPAAVPASAVSLE